MHMAPELEDREVLAFAGIKVYFSNSIKGEIGSSEDIGLELVDFMIRSGADVLTENIVFRNPELGLPVFEKRTGVDLTKVTDQDERARIIRRADLEWL